MIGAEVYLLLPQAAILPGSDTGSDGFEPASDFVLQTVRPDVWGTLLERGLRFVQGRRTCNSVKERDPICALTMESPNTSSQAVHLTQAVRGKLIPTNLTLVMGMKSRSLDALSQYSVFHQ